MKKYAMLVSLRKTQFNGEDGRLIEFAKVQLGILTDNGYEIADFYVGKEICSKICNLQVGIVYEAYFDVDFQLSKIRLIDLKSVN